jgi:hypothetical protein
MDNRKEKQAKYKKVATLVAFPDDNAIIAGNVARVPKSEAQIETLLA